jgi:hypothetical protein
MLPATLVSKKVLLIAILTGHISLRPDASWFIPYFLAKLFQLNKKRLTIGNICDAADPFNSTRLFFQPVDGDA